MKADILERYETAADGSFYIDVAAGKAEDLYNNFDRSAPYIRRDLQRDLVEYLIECARELGNEAFVVRFTLGEPPDESRLSRIRHSVRGFFLYLAESERQKLLKMMRRAAILFFTGVAILSIAVWVNKSVWAQQAVVGNVFAEGLTVAAWVSLWEALAVVLIEWSPHRRNIRLYRRIANTQLLFRDSGSLRQR